MNFFITLCVALDSIIHRLMKKHARVSGRVKTRTGIPNRLFHLEFFAGVDVHAVLAHALVLLGVKQQSFADAERIGVRLPAADDFAATEIDNRDKLADEVIILV